ncbi:MAG TPA: hypothetical protein VMA13_11380, partial [Candidatus Saccharimonadales bacterium]|nr:hypothetical protein [Candidatus Saccharimonadales bacterium]
MKKHYPEIFPARLNRTLFAAAAIAMTAGTAIAGTDYWNGGVASGNWSSGANWLGGLVPMPTDALVFTNQSGLNDTPNDDFANGTTFDGISILNSSGGSTFTITGNSILLSGQTSGITTGITNGTSLNEVVNNNLALDWGYYTFYSPAGGLTMGGSLALNPGSVADFGGNVTNNALTVDGTGLIYGLGGAGLIGNNGLGSANSGGGFSALATVVNGAITSYTYPADAIISAGEAIGGTSQSTASNLEITVTGSATFALNGGTAAVYAATNATYINTILLNINTTTKNTGIIVPNGNGTLVLGTNEGNMYIGGIYLPGGQTAQEIQIGSGNSTFLTCGPMIAGN